MSDTKKALHGLMKMYLLLWKIALVTRILTACTNSLVHYKLLYSCT